MGASCYAHAYLDTCANTYIDADGDSHTPAADAHGNTNSDTLSYTVPFGCYHGDADGGGIISMMSSWFESGVDFHVL